MTHIKYLVLALAIATAGAAPPSLRGLKDASGAETIGDAFELPLAITVSGNRETTRPCTSKLFIARSPPLSRVLRRGAASEPGHTYPPCKKKKTHTHHPRVVERSREKENNGTTYIAYSRVAGYRGRRRR